MALLYDTRCRRPLGCINGLIARYGSFGKTSLAGSTVKPSSTLAAKPVTAGGTVS
jgi:hypothetical protein